MFAANADTGCRPPVRSENSHVLNIRLVSQVAPPLKNARDPTPVAVRRVGLPDSRTSETPMTNRQGRVVARQIRPDSGTEHTMALGR